MRKQNEVDLGSLKIALVYDRVNKWGGAERVLLTLHEMFPNASLFTSVYDEKRAHWAKAFPKIQTSFLQRIYFLRNKHEYLGWLMPLVFESFDFSEFDLVISITSEAAKGIVTKPNTLHVCYCLTPTRYLWSHENIYFKNTFLKLLTSPLIAYLKKWEKVGSTRPDKYIAISTDVKTRIQKYYKKDSEIIFPPVSLNPDYKNPHQKDNGDYYLVVSRLVGYKSVKLVVDTFNENGLALVIVGTGREESFLKESANKNIKFVGKVADEQLIKYYSKAKALILPQYEDFGIVSVEAQLCGIPIIAYKKGGAIDTVIDKKTGIFFEQQSVKSLKQAIANFSKIGFNHRYIRENAKRFSKETFKTRLQETLVRTYIGRRRRNPTLAKIR